MSTIPSKANDVKKVASATEKANPLKVEAGKIEQNATFERKKEEIKQLINPVSADQRLKNAELFSKMAEKYTFLKRKQDELQSYMVGRDGLKEKVIIKCEGCEDFEVSNSLIINEILEISAEKLENLVKESENEILNFNI